jgi:hypothetical protein
MNTNIAARFTTLAITTTAILSLAGTQAGAATLRCNAANKGRVAQTKVCSFEKGRYAWVQVVAQPNQLLDTNIPQAPATPAVAAKSALTGQTFRANTGYWSATLLPSWKGEMHPVAEVSAFGAYPQASYSDSGLASNPSIYFNVQDTPRPSAKYDVTYNLNYNADLYTNETWSVLSRDVRTVDGRTAGRLVFVQNDSPEMINTEYYFDSADGQRNIVIRTSYVKGEQNSAKYKVELDQMVAAVSIR